MKSAQPLHGFTKFRSRDLDESRQTIGGVFCSHQILLRGQAANLDTEVRLAPFAQSALTFIRYGTAVDINATHIDDYFIVQVPWNGEIEVDNGRHTALFNPEVASVISPIDAMSMRWSEGSSFFTVKLNRRRVENCLVQLLGHELQGPLVFDSAVELASDEGKRWCNAVHFVRQQIEQPIPLSMKQQLESQLEDTLCLMLLELVSHNYSEQLRASGGIVAPKTIKLACEYIHDNLDQCISMEELASATSVSTATLTKHFRSTFGQSPMQYVRQKKLDAVHQALNQASLDSSVTTIALQYGFNHLGRFSQYYQERFGQMPSVTLKSS